MKIRYRKVLILNDNEEDTIDNLAETLVELGLITNIEEELLNGFTCMGRKAHSVEIEYDMNKENTT